METYSTRVITNVCRTCLGQLTMESAIVSLDCVASNSDLVTLRSKLQSCIPEIDLTVELSSSLCGECTATVEHAYKFRKKCLETEKEIHNFLKLQNETTTMPSLALIQVEMATEESMHKDISETDPVAAPESSSSSAVDMPDIELVPEPNQNPQTHLEIINTDSIQFNTDAAAEDGVGGDMVLNYVARDKMDKKDGENKKLYKCNICSYRTTQQSTIALHMRIHAAKESYKCKHCPFRTSCKTQLKQHELETHIVRSIFKCRKCIFSTTTMASFVEHTLKHEKSAPLHCSRCDFSTINKSSLKVHLRSHAAEPVTVYLCKTCKVIFHTELTLREHKKIHIQESPDIICLD